MITDEYLNEVADKLEELAGNDKLAMQHTQLQEAIAEILIRLMGPIQLAMLIADPLRAIKTYIIQGIMMHEDYLKNLKESE